MLNLNRIKNASALLHASFRRTNSVDPLADSPELVKHKGLHLHRSLVNKQSSPVEKCTATLEIMHGLRQQYEEACDTDLFFVDRFPAFLKAQLLPFPIDTTTLRDLSAAIVQEFGTITAALTRVMENPPDVAQFDKAKELLSTLQDVHECVKTNRNSRINEAPPARQHQVRAAVEECVRQLATRNVQKSRYSGLRTEIKTELDIVVNNMETTNAGWTPEGALEMMHGKSHLLEEEKALPSLQDKTYNDRNFVSSSHKRPEDLPGQADAADRLYVTFNIDGEKKHLIFDGRNPSTGEFRGTNLAQALACFHYEDLEELMQKGLAVNARIYSRIPAIHQIMTPLVELERSAGEQVSPMIKKLCEDPGLKPLLEKLRISEEDIREELASGKHG